MDAAVTVAVIGFLGTLATAIVGAFVAILTNRTEKLRTAETALERTLRERLALRDDRIAGLEAIILRLREKNEEQEFVIRELREQLEPEQRDHHDDG